MDEKRNNLSREQMPSAAANAIRVIPLSELRVPLIPRRRKVARIELAHDTVKVRGDRLGEVWWQGEQWSVTDYGLECRDGTYCIEAARLRDAYPWPVHMAEKDWVSIDDFTTAWIIALALHAADGPRLLKLFTKLPPIGESMWRTPPPPTAPA